MNQLQLEQHYTRVDEIIRSYYQNTTWKEKQKMYICLLEELQNYMAKQTDTYGNENSVHEDVEEVQNTINLVQKYL